MSEHWDAQAACRANDPEWMFPERADTAGRNRAVEICTACPVRTACLDDAMEKEGNVGKEYRWGIRGGLTPWQRRRLYEQRNPPARTVDAEAAPEREVNRGGRPRAECGTPSAYNRHVRYHEAIDQACRDAHNKQQSEARQQRAARAAA